MTSSYQILTTVKCACGVTDTAEPADLVIAGWSYEDLGLCPDCNHGCAGRHAWSLPAPDGRMVCSNVHCDAKRQYRPVERDVVAPARDALEWLESWTPALEWAITGDGNLLGVLPVHHDSDSDDGDPDFVYNQWVSGLSLTPIEPVIYPDGRHWRATGHADDQVRVTISIRESRGRQQ